MPFLALASALVLPTFYTDSAPPTSYSGTPSHSIPPSLPPPRPPSLQLLRCGQGGVQLDSVGPSHPLQLAPGQLPRPAVPRLGDALDPLAGQFFPDLSEHILSLEGAGGGGAARSSLFLIP